MSGEVITLFDKRGRRVWRAHEVVLHRSLQRTDFVHAIPYLFLESRFLSEYLFKRFQDIGVDTDTVERFGLQLLAFVPELRPCQIEDIGQDDIRRLAVDTDVSAVKKVVNRLLALQPDIRQIGMRMQLRVGYNFSHDHPPSERRKEVDDEQLAKLTRLFYCVYAMLTGVTEDFSVPGSEPTPPTPTPLPSAS